MQRTLGRVRTRQVVIASMGALVLLVVGARYVWLHEERRDTETRVATVTGQLREALALFREVEDTRVDADTRNATTEAHRNQIRSAADSLREELGVAKADTTAAAIGAYTTGAQANNLRACLTGVSQALNQLAVGDGGETASLRAVEVPCRAVGIR